MVDDLLGELEVIGAHEREHARAQDEVVVLQFGHELPVGERAPGALQRLRRRPAGQGPVPGHVGVEQACGERSGSHVVGVTLEPCHRFRRRELGDGDLPDLEAKGEIMFAGLHGAGDGAFE